MKYKFQKYIFLEFRFDKLTCYYYDLDQQWVQFEFINKFDVHFNGIPDISSRCFSKKYFII